jgi:hypothetical protein
MGGARNAAQPRDYHSTLAEKRTPGLGPRLATRNAHRGGRAAGAYIIRRRRAADLTLCDCCSCIVVAGAEVVDVIGRDGPLQVCADCAGPA